MLFRSVILDEAQNTTSQQIRMFLTRMGTNTKMIITGDVIRVDGHDYAALAEAFAAAAACKGKPTVLLARTVKGKGVSFMEGDYGLHGKAPNAEQYEKARAELSARVAELEGK